MGFIGALLHLLNLFAPAIGVAAIGAGLVKLFWRSELRSVPWSRLVGVAACAQCLVILLGLIVFGRDGKMATYGAMVLGGATALWWSAFVARR